MTLGVEWGRGGVIDGAGLLYSLLPSGATDAQADGREALRPQALTFQRGYAAAGRPVAGCMELSTSTYAAKA